MMENKEHFLPRTGQKESPMTIQGIEPPFHDLAFVLVYHNPCSNPSSQGQFNQRKNVSRLCFIHLPQPVHTNSPVFVDHTPT